MTLYAKVCFDGEGVVEEEVFATQNEAAAFVAGFEAAQRISKEADDDPLDEYFVAVGTEPAKEKP